MDRWGLIKPSYASSDKRESTKILRLSPSFLRVPSSASRVRSSAAPHAFSHSSPPPLLRFPFILEKADFPIDLKRGSEQLLDKNRHFALISLLEALDCLRQLLAPYLECRQRPFEIPLFLLGRFVNGTVLGEYVRILESKQAALLDAVQEAGGRIAPAIAGLQATEEQFSLHNE
jgi:hypothetical protein